MNKTQWSLDEVDVAPHWGRFLAIGLVMMALGFVSIAFARQSTIASVVIYGALVIVAGVVELAGAFFAGSAGRVVLHLLGGVLSVVVGGLLVAHPNLGAAALTLMLAALFLVSGIYRFIAAISFGFPNWGWAALSAVVTSICGVMIWMQWPIISLWAIGMFIGVDFLTRGWTWTMIAVAARQIAHQVEAH